MNNTNAKSYKCAFTLAETLITLFALGVVAVLTLPTLSLNIKGYALEKQRKVFEQKFEEGLRQMCIDDKLAEKYSGTLDFVKEMNKYYKIAKICNKDHLSECFAESFVYRTAPEYTLTNKKKETDSDEKDIDLFFSTNLLKTTTDLATITGVDAQFDSDFAGIVFIDGVQMLIAVKPNCVGVTSGDITDNLYSCINYIADVNSSKTPNNVKHDIVTNIKLTN